MCFRYIGAFLEIGVAQTIGFSLKYHDFWMILGSPSQPIQSNPVKV